MTLAGDILAAYRGFGASMQKQMSQPIREEKLLFYVIFASLLGFISRIPGLLTVAQTTADTEITVTNLIGTGFATTLFYGPIMLYLVAALSHLIAKVFGGKGTSQQARLAFFWALVVISPLLLVSTMVRTIFPVPEIVFISHTIVSILFIYCWAVCLSIAEKFPRPYLTTATIVGIFGLIFVIVRVTLVNGAT